MSTHTRQTITILLSWIPSASPSTEPCIEANPDLWRIWCEINGRDPVTSDSVWTEADVTYSSIMIIARHLREITADEQ